MKSTTWSGSGCDSGKPTARPFPKWWAWAPRVVAEGLRLLHDPLPGLLVPGPHAHPGAVARAIAASLGPPRALDAAPSWLDASQAEAFAILLHALREHGAVLCADPVGSGKTYLALAIAQRFKDAPAVCLVPPALAGQWEETAQRLAVPVTIWSHARLSRGRLPLSDPSLVVVDESHHFRHPGIRRYRTLAPWLIGRHVLLLSATPIVNRPADLYHQLHLGLRDDALVEEGAVSLRAAFIQDSVPSALGRFVIQRRAAAALPQPRHRDEAVMSGAVPLLPGLDALRLSSHPEVAALVRVALLHAAASSPAALMAALRRYRHLLLQAHDAVAAGVPIDRQGLRRIVGSSQGQLVMWPLMAGTDAKGELCLDDLPVVDKVLAETLGIVDRPDPKAARLGDILQDDVLTLVYVTARETIHYLRRHLPDRWLAWCSGQRAGIGGTPLSRADVLRWFRPDAPHHPPHFPSRPRTLLTTDVTAEGLDLQGAGRVVHYDLPWTEVRLAQRDGRAVRRGSTRTHVDIVRFLPARAIERRLHQLESLTRKSGLPRQFGLGMNGHLVWRWRSDLADTMIGSRVEGICTVRSTRPGALAGVVLERRGRAAVSVALVRDATSPWVTEPDEVCRRLHETVRGTPQPPPSKTEVDRLLSTLASSVRSLLRDASRGRVCGLPPTLTALALGRRLRRLAAEAARRRDAALLALLERGLGFCTRGHTAGEAMLIESMVGDNEADLVARLEQLHADPEPLTPLQPRLTGLIVFRQG